MKALKPLIFLIIFAQSLAAQSTLTQAIKGQVIEKDTDLPLIGASIFILGSDPLIGTTTDENGYYRFAEQPVGRYSIACSYVGYQETSMDNLLLTTGKELVVDFYLIEDMAGIEVEVTTIVEQDVKTSELTTISVQEFNADVASRYAGSRSDVARMAAGFAGVSANDDARNDIVIRGNSPSGLLWRLNGIDIPNPSHFGALGATGGPVSMLNNNLLDNSTFITGAFPANYGNALSGVFDLKMRKGNKDKLEGLAQVGFNGFEAGLEGPLSKKSGASFLINYRYSVIDLISKLGGNSGEGTGTGTAIPGYQDLSFNVYVPTKKLGTFSVFGIGGNSGIDFLSDLETDSNNLFSGDNENLYYDTYMQVVGATNKHYFNNKSYGKLSLSFSRSGVNSRLDTLTTSFEEIPVFRDDSSTDRYRIAYDYKNKFNKKHSLIAGVNVNHFEFNFVDSVRMSNGQFRILRDFQGDAQLNQGYAQWQYKASPRLTVNLGLFAQYYNYNNTNALEPRFNMKYRLNSTISWSLGLGRHSKLQDFQLYTYQTQLDDGSSSETTNENLDFTKSDQIITGIEWSLTPKWHVKTELYLQQLSSIPVEQKSSSFSALNLGADFAIPSRDSLVNEGTGTNYGLELTINRSFSNGFYLLSTMSFFKSTYEGSDEITRSTAFDNGYVVNLLSGKEFQLSDKFSLAADTKVTFAGGRRHTAIDIQASIEEGETVLFEDQIYEMKFDDYFRADFKITMRHNMKRLSEEFSIDIQNLFDTQNVFGQAFNARTNKITTSFQLGRYPVFNYRLNF